MTIDQHDTHTGLTMLDEGWTLSPRVELRPEPFGALAYHFGNRRLSFMKRRDLVEVVEALGTSADVRTALQTAGVQDSRWPAYVEALQGLARTDMIVPRTPDQEKS